MALVRATLVGLRASDRLAGDEDATGVAIVALRDGRRVARVHLLRDPDGGWLLDEATLCAGLGLEDRGATASAASSLGMASPGGSPSAVPFDLSGCQTKGLCGVAKLGPSSAHVGDTVTVETAAYFSVITESWCRAFGVAFDYAPPDGPAGGFMVAPVRILDASHAVFTVPVLPAGRHSLMFVCGRDGGFAHPEFDGALEVIAASG